MVIGERKKKKKKRETPMVVRKRNKRKKKLKRKEQKEENAPGGNRGGWLKSLPEQEITATERSTSKQGVTSIGGQRRRRTEQASLKTWKGLVDDRWRKRFMDGSFMGDGFRWNVVEARRERTELGFRGTGERNMGKRRNGGPFRMDARRTEKKREKMEEEGRRGSDVDGGGAIFLGEKALQRREREREGRHGRKIVQEGRGGDRRALWETGPCGCGVAGVGNFKVNRIEKEEEDGHFYEVGSWGLQLRIGKRGS